MHLCSLWYMQRSKFNFRTKPMENYVYMACDDIFQANEKWHTIMDWWKKKAIVRLNAVDTRMPLRTRKSKNNVAADRVFEMLYSFCDGQPNDVASAAIALIHTHNSLIHYPVLGESLLHLTLYYLLWQLSGIEHVSLFFFSSGPSLQI